MLPAHPHAFLPPLLPAAFPQGADAFVRAEANGLPLVRHPVDSSPAIYRAGRIASPHPELQFLPPTLHKARIPSMKLVLATLSQEGK